MSEGIGLLIAIAILICLFGFLLFLFQEKNHVLRLLFIMAILVSGFFIPTAVYQLRTNCDSVVANATAINSSVNSYEYKQFCYTTTSTAPDTFYTIAWSIYQIIIFYFIIHVIVLLATPVWERLKRW